MEAADDWLREHLPDPDEFSLEDNEEEGETQKYFFLRYRDSATVVYLVAVKDGKVTSVKKEVYYAGGYRALLNSPIRAQLQWTIDPQHGEQLSSFQVA
jgi:hypothetical protein